LQQARHAVVHAAVDEGRPARLDDEVGRVELRAHIAGVDGMDAMAEVFEEVAHTVSVLNEG